MNQGGHTRRQILKAAAGAAGLALAAPIRRLAAQDAGIERLSDDLFVVASREKRTSSRRPAATARYLSTAHPPLQPTR